MKTAMQELFDTMKQKGQFIPEYIKKDFLKKEKEQIINAHGDKTRGGFNSAGNFFHELKTGEEYYNETYKNK